ICRVSDSMQEREPVYSQRRHVLVSLIRRTEAVICKHDRKYASSWGKTKKQKQKNNTPYR
ncbi:hypothetical protein ABFV55_28005, partial [Pseudomonas syringae]|uniref:hypothetical protein n=1 Tax=Pseudomonas syringae TaxID=317 RepID=UPI0034D9580E